jgi:uncharacterized protein (DUF885 family)
MERDVSFAASTLGRLAGAGGVDAAFLRDHRQQETADAQRELRGAQDVRRFHDAVLAGGPLPLRLLQAESGRLPSP